MSTDIIKLVKSAVSAAGMVCRVFFMPTAPKYTAMV